MNTARPGLRCGPGTMTSQLRAAGRPASRRGATIQHPRGVHHARRSGQSMPVDFEWSTTGFVSAARTTATETPSSSSIRVAARRRTSTCSTAATSQTGDSVIVATSAALNRNNPQSTKVTAPETGIPVTVGEDGDISDCTGNSSADCFGQASDHQRRQRVRSTPAGFRVDIVYNANKPNAQFDPLLRRRRHHRRGHHERCTFRASITPNNAPCVQRMTTCNGRDVRHRSTSPRTARPSATDRPLGGGRTHEAGAQAPASALSRDSSWATVTMSPLVR